MVKPCPEVACLYAATGALAAVTLVLLSAAVAPSRA